MPPEFVGLKDPKEWSVERTTGFRFRRATAYEVAQNGWQPGTFFVETDQLKSQASSGQPLTQPLLFPTSDSNARPIALETLGPDPEAVDDGAVTIEMHAQDGISSGVVQYFRYLTPATEHRQTGEWDIDGALFMLVASDDGDQGLAGTGLVDNYSMTIETIEDADVFETISGGAGPAVDPDDVVVFHLLVMTEPEQGGYDQCVYQLNCGDVCLVWQNPTCDGCSTTNPCLDPYKPNNGQCSNNWDDDHDGATDEADMCQHNSNCDPNAGWPPHLHRWEGGETLFLTGSIAFCSNHANDWNEKLYGIIALSAIDSFNNATGSGVFDGLTKRTKMRWGGIQCWVLDDPDDAGDCQDSGTNCGPFSSGNHYYPFQGFGSDPNSYNSNAWAAVEHAASVGLGLPQTLSQVVLDDTLVSGSDGACGQAPQPGTTSTIAHTDGCTHTSEHEIGHNLGAGHCDVVCDSNSCTIMGNDNDGTCPADFDNSHRDPWFSVGAASTLVSAIQSGSSPGTLQFGYGYFP